MLTQCPNCQTTFRVTSEILRVAEGQVRCGRCQTQFDALERLIEESAAQDVQSGRYLRPSQTPPPSTIEVDEPVTHEDVTLEGRHIEISGTYEVIDDADEQRHHLTQRTTEEWVEIDDVNDPTASGDYEINVEQDYLEEDASLDELASVAAAAVKERYAVEASPRVYERPDDEPPEFDLAAHSPRRGTLAWKLLAAPLALLLAVQAVHYNRAELARHPRYGAPLIDAYAALGLVLTPEWDLHAYEVRQWGVVSDPASPGTLRVRASIANLAQFSQPYPLLKLVLEDRWGDQVRAREFQPEEYLDPGAAANRLLAPAQKTNVTIAIIDPGPDAEGFRFDVCLTGARGPVCAGEIPQGRSL